MKQNQIDPSSLARPCASQPTPPERAAISVHDVAVFAVAIPRKPGTPWESVEKSDVFANIQMMIQALVDQEVAAALAAERSSAD